MPTGLKRKQHLNIGDCVKYIFYDGKTTVLRKSKLENMKAYYQLFKKFEKRFEK